MRDRSDPKKRDEIIRRLDYYWPLLSKKTQEVMYCFFYEDYSFREIAEQLGISRQAAHDYVNRGLRKVEQLENQLGFFRHETEAQNILKKVVLLLDLNDQISARRELLRLKDHLAQMNNRSSEEEGDPAKER